MHAIYTFWLFVQNYARHLSLFMKDEKGFLAHEQMMHAVFKTGAVEYDFRCVHANKREFSTILSNWVYYFLEYGFINCQFF